MARSFDFLKCIGCACFAALLSLAVAQPAYAEPITSFLRPDALITADELALLISTDAPNMVIITAASDAQYEAGHIPGALLAERTAYTAVLGETNAYAGMIANGTQFQKFARQLGISGDTAVVVYDHRYDATRLWWAFYLYGKTDVRVLDGGLAAWQAAGMGLETQVPNVPAAGDFVADVDPGTWSIDQDYIAEQSAAGNMQLWDTREESEWTGERLAGSASRPGRIPGAGFVNWREFRSPDGRFLAAPQMSALLERLEFDEGREQIFYCNSGVRATQGIFGLFLMGWDVSRLHNFDGSWIAWSQDPSNDVICESCP